MKKGSNYPKAVLRVMRFTLGHIIIVILFSGMSYASNTHAQSVLDRRITLSLHGVPLQEALSEIEREAKVSFVYSREFIEADKKVFLHANDKKLKGVLTDLLQDFNIRFRAIDELIILRRSVAPVPVELSNINPVLKAKHLRQDFTVSGLVSDAETGEVLPGVSISLKNSDIGVVSDTEGKYQLSIPVIYRNGTLVVTLIGYLRREIQLDDQRTIDILLEQDIARLNEVVVIGYGVQEKSDLTGSVVRADIEAFRESPNISIAQSLHGIVPGLDIGQVNTAGQNPSISVRGRTTLSGNRDVLLVVDGIIYSGELMDLNPNDISSVDILKDASSKAIYGAQAANGVILVTTKTGRKAAKPIFNYSGSFTTQSPANSLTFMNREEFIRKAYDVDWELAYEAPDYTQLKPDLEFSDYVTLPEIRAGYENGNDFDWWDATTNPAYIHAHNLGVRGSSDNFSYFISGGYTQQRGFILNDEFERYTARINIENRIFDWFAIGTQSFVSLSDYSGDSPGLGALSRFTPLVTPYDEEGNYALNPTGGQLSNPFLTASADDLDKRNSLFGNFYVDLDIPFVNGLNYRLNFGNNYSWEKRFNSNEFDNGATGGALKRNASRYDQTLDHILSYKTTLENVHAFDVTLVAGQRKRQFEETVAQGSNFSNLGLIYNNLSLATIQEIGSAAWTESYLYQMARLNYAFNSTYLLTATLRRDGFSGFAENEKTAFFPSVGLGWVVSNESFMANDWISNLKLRGSYGQNGNLVSRYASLARLDNYPAYVFGDGGSTLFGQRVQSLANPGLTWETTAGYNIGIDFSLWNSRISGNIDYYNTTTNDLIYNVSLPEITGFNQITTNVGEIANRGIELALNYRILHNNRFSWNLNFNISSNRNEIRSLIGLDVDGDGQEDDLQASGLFIGESINSIFSYESAGIIQLGEEAPEGFFVGTHRIVDQNGDGVINPNDDRIIIGRQEPAFRFGILNELSYKNFTLRLFVNSVQGGQNGYLGRNMPDGFGGNVNHAKRENRWLEFDYWTPANPDARYRRLDQGPAFNYIYYGDRSFIRLQDVTLAYTLGSEMAKKIGFKNLKVFASAKNLHTWTDWVGWDPETGSGISSGGRPVMRGFSLGLDVSF